MPKFEDKQRVVMVDADGYHDSRITNGDLGTIEADGTEQPYVYFDKLNGDVLAVREDRLSAWVAPETSATDDVVDAELPPADKHAHYFHDVSHLDKIDIYRMIDLLAIEHPALQHSFKKVAAAGKRGAKDQAQDVQEAIDSLVRWQSMQAEDAAK